jgi:hypothetical protein
LALFLENKFKWVEIVASIKKINLVIEDHTVSMTAGLRSLSEKYSRDSGYAVDGTDIEGSESIPIYFPAVDGCYRCLISHVLSIRGGLVQRK